MKKIIIYFDCDGVILNTIETAKQMAKEEGVNLCNRNEFDHFFQIVDWNILIYRAGILDNAIRKIKKIMETEKYEVKILTKLSGNENEELIKRRLFAKLLPDVPVITLNIDENKDEIVNPVGNILIEDSIDNAKRWNDANGIGLVLNFKKFNYENDIIDDIEKFEETSGVKRLLKTINY